MNHTDLHSPTCYAPLRGVNISVRISDRTWEAAC